VQSRARHDERKFTCKHRRLGGQEFINQASITASKAANNPMAPAIKHRLNERVRIIVNLLSFECCEATTGAGICAPAGPPWARNPLQSASSNSRPATWKLQLFAPATLGIGTAIPTLGRTGEAATAAMSCQTSHH
jgi:hypothetical protein